MPLLPREGSAARQRVLAQRLRLQVRLERTAEGQIARALRQAVAEMFTDDVLTTADVDTSLANLRRRMTQLLTTAWRVAMHSTAEQVFTGMEELRKSYTVAERKDRTAERTFANKVAAWIERFGGQRITDIDEHTRAEAVGTIASGKAENKTTDQIRRDLEGSQAFSRTRAALIARTEVHTAGSAAADLAAQAVSDETGVTLKREWIAAEDDRTRSAHADADGQVRGMDEAFNFEDEQGGYSLMAPGDPGGPPRATINCRCALGYVPS
jgi:uncharacterized protein with gpF-like domain